MKKILLKKRVIISFILYIGFVITLNFYNTNGVEQKRIEKSIEDVWEKNITNVKVLEQRSLNDKNYLLFSFTYEDDTSKEINYSVIEKKDFKFWFDKYYTFHKNNSKILVTNENRYLYYVEDYQNFNTFIFGVNINNADKMILSYRKIENKPFDQNKTYRYDVKDQPYIFVHTTRMSFLAQLELIK